MKRLTITAWLLALTVLVSSGCSRDSSSVGEDAATDAATDAPLSSDLTPSPDANAGPMALATELTAEPMTVRGTSMVLDGENYVVVWAALVGTSRDHQLMFTRVSADGKVIDPPSVVMTFEVSPVSLRLFVGEGGFRLWFREAITSDAFWAARLDSSGKLESIEKLDLGDHGHCRYNVAVDFTGEHFGLLMEKYDSVEKLYRVHFQRFSWDLVPLGESVAVDTAAMGQHCPSLDWISGPTQGQFLGLWVQDERIRRAWLDDTGSVKSVAPLHDATEPQQYPWAIADGSGGALVFWRNHHSKSPLTLRVDSEKNLWKSPARLLPDNRAESIDLSVAIYAGQVMAAWQTDLQTALPMIKTGWFDLNDSTPRLQNVETITDPSNSYSNPHAVTGDGEVALIFTSASAGSQHLHFRTFKRR